MRVWGLPIRANEDTRIRPRAHRASCGFSLAPKFMRGMERREAQMWCFASGIACEAMLSRKRVALRRSICGDFGREDRTSGSGRVPSDPLSNWLSPAFILSASSRERQSHVVGPDGDPSLPDVWLRTTSRRRRILFRLKAPSRSAPHEQDDTDYIPISANVKIAMLIHAPSFRGARLRASPESRTIGRMDSGPAPRGASRNDGERGQQ